MGSMYHSLFCLLTVRRVYTGVTHIIQQGQASVHGRRRCRFARKPHHHDHISQVIKDRPIRTRNNFVCRQRRYLSMPHISNDALPGSSTSCPRSALHQPSGHSAHQTILHHACSSGTEGHGHKHTGVQGPLLPHRHSHNSSCERCQRFMYQDTRKVDLDSIPTLYPDTTYRAIKSNVHLSFIPGHLSHPSSK